MGKKAYSRIVLHIASAAKKDLKQFLVLLNDTDVVMYNLACTIFIIEKKCVLKNERRKDLGGIWNL